MNDVSGKLVPCTVGKVKKLNGEIIKSPKELLDELNVPPVTSTREISPAEADLKIKTDDFDREKIEKTIKGLKNYKAPGFVYNITVETIQYDGDELSVRL